MIGSDKKKLYPNENIKTVCYLSNLPKRPNVEIGDYTYYSDHKNSPEKFYDNLKSATSLTKCYRLKRNVLLIRNPPIQSARPFQCAYHPLTP